MNYIFFCILSLSCLFSLFVYIISFLPKKIFIKRFYNLKQWVAMLIDMFFNNNNYGKFVYFFSFIIVNVRLSVTWHNSNSSTPNLFLRAEIKLVGGAGSTCSSQDLSTKESVLIKNV